MLRDPLEVANSRLTQAKNMRLSKERQSDQLTYELGMLHQHISDLQDIVDYLKEQEDASE